MIRKAFVMMLILALAFSLTACSNTAKKVGEQRVLFLQYLRMEMLH